ncbi:hypothetical protein ASF58_23375 [Methylobacterium sp. Leaf125]|uniref:hypothetical protein n=1 Tax=Methylobacterium sp. Leaf125 TaxID=1736265 RepID=UPI0006FA5962|nr:hypothetical protein [Methylobacterium sp. Leaf125]KQQ39085.1 hypothetical protein ASF58_23375 [Methylobacterium sp. Leaf125]
MTAPSLLLAARKAKDARERILYMAETMRDLAHGSTGACTFGDLCAAGFTEAEIHAYRDDARVAIAGRPSPLRTIPIGRLKGIAMVKTARAIRRRIDQGATP